MIYLSNEGLNYGWIFKDNKKIEIYGDSYEVFLNEIDKY